MSAPVWLMEALNLSKLARVPNVPNQEKTQWEQDNYSQKPINIGLAKIVPIIPNVPNEILPTIDQSEVEDRRREYRRSKVLELLEAKQFAVLVENAETDPVIAMIGIRNMATFEIAIPQHFYDATRLLELIEKYYGANDANC